MTILRIVQLRGRRNDMLRGSLNIMSLFRTHKTSQRAYTISILLLLTVSRNECKFQSICSLGEKTGLSFYLFTCNLTECAFYCIHIFDKIPSASLSLQGNILWGCKIVTIHENEIYSVPFLWLCYQIYVLEIFREQFFSYQNTF